jgi:transmembrane protein 231
MLIIQDLVSCDGKPCRQFYLNIFLFILTVGTYLQSDYTMWKASSNINTFTINALVRYSKQQVTFIPGFWQQIKWGWIQYISVLLPFLFVFKTIKIFIYENQLVPTIVTVPALKQKDA